MRIAADPRLYDPATEDPILLGNECRACGRVYFPRLGIGCESCGAGEDKLAPKALPAAGVVHSVAEVHLAPPPTKTPFTIAEIILDAGPLIRAIVHPDSATAQIGDRVSGLWNVVKVNDEGADVVEPAFVVTSTTAGAQA